VWDWNVNPMPKPNSGTSWPVWPGRPCH